MPYLGHIGDPHLMILPAVLLVASNDDVGCSAAHSVSAPRASPLAAMSLFRDPISFPQKSAYMAASHPHQTSDFIAACSRDAGGPAGPCKVSVLGGRLTLARGVQPADAVLVRQRVEDVVQPAWCARGPAAARRARESWSGSTQKPLAFAHITYGIRRRSRIVRTAKASAKRDIS